MNQTPIRVGIVVGETSGDVLGAGLMQAILSRYPNATFEGMAGDRMISLDMTSMFPMDRLSVMGLIDPLKRLPELLHIRKTLREHFLANPPDVFIGIDSPDFNLGLEKPLKTAGIKTVHYVSPSVWAWRQNRIHNIKRSVDLMLCLLPFEAKFYQQHSVAVEFVGHPLCEELSFQPLKYFDDAPIICLMAGSRRGEVAALADVYIEAAQHILAAYPKAQFIMPAANALRLDELKQRCLVWQTHYPQVVQSLDIRLQGAHQAMAESHFVISTSGTTTLEAMLIGKPMVIAYKLHWLTYAIVKRIFKAPFFGLPNLLADEMLAPELLQHNVTGKALASVALQFLSDDELRIQTIDRFQQLRDVISRNASETAAKAVIDLIES